MALCLAMLCGGILFVLETSKGQLVIESDNADVQVKLVKDGLEASELHIEPGTQTTRLHGGKYEIVIDAPSDNFTVSNQQFTIRDGETVVAKITTRPPASASPTPSDILSALRVDAPEDKRLSAVVYEGDSLDVWLRRLKFERSSKKIDEALAAINAITDDKVSDLVEPVIVEFMMNPETSPERFEAAIEVLYKSSGERFFDNLTEILECLRTDVRKENLLGFANRFIGASDVANLAQLSRFLTWSTHALEDDSVRLSVGTVLRSMFFDYVPTRVFPAECQQAAMDVLLSSKKLTDAEFWLAENERFPWVASFRIEIIRRALVVLADTNADAQLVVQAALVLNSTVEFGNRLSDEQRLQLIDALNRRFEQGARELKSFIASIDVSRALAKGAAPILLNQAWKGGESETAVNQSIALMNMVAKFELRDELKDSLTVLHDSLASQPLHGEGFSRYQMRGGQWDEVGRAAQRDSGTIDKLFLQTAYVQSGLLIGKNLKELVGRFEQTKAADIAVAVNGNLDKLESELLSGVDRAALGALYQTLTRDQAQRAIPLLTRFLVEHFKGATFWSEALAMLGRVSGDQFFVHFTEILEATSGEQRAALLSIDFSTLLEFQCSDPESLTGFLNWADSIFGSDRKDDIAIQPTLAKMLRSLLRDRSSLVERQRISRAAFEMAPGVVSEDCQRLILSHLEKYPQLTDQNFWLAEPVRYRDDTSNNMVANTIAPMDKVFRATMLEHALAALAPNVQTSSDLDQHRTHALMVIRSVVTEGDELSPQQVDEVKRYLAELLNDSAQDLAKSSVLKSQWGPFGYLAKPQWPLKDYTDYSGPGNTLLAGLNLIQELKLASELVGPLQTLFEAAEEPRITRNYYSNRESPWDIRIRDAERYNGGYTELYTQTVYLLTGTLLGKDENELLKRPDKVKRENAEARLRFVHAGDTLAVYIPNFLPVDGSSPPVLQAGKSPPVTGYPVPVNTQGEITVPGLEPLPVEGKDLKEVRELLVQALAKLVRPDEFMIRGITVQFLMHAGEEVEIRNVSGQAIPTER